MFPILNKRGFTLIELIVVMAVFLFIIGAGLGIFISIVHGQRRVLAEQQILSQVSYLEEYMSKALRAAKTSDGTEGCLGEMGEIYNLTRSDGLYQGIKFINQSENGTCQEFFLDVVSDPDNFVLKELKNSVSDEDAVALTSDILKINYMRFSINGADGSDNGNNSVFSVSDRIQPRVTILLNITIPGDSEGGNTTKTIQTTVSRRNLNVLR